MVAHADRAALLLLLSLLLNGAPGCTRDWSVGPRPSDGGTVADAALDAQPLLWDAPPQEATLWDGPRKDGHTPDVIPPDAKVTTPDAATECKKHSDCKDVCSVGTCNNGKCNYSPASPTTVCRAKKGSCDKAELCDGKTRSCPADKVAVKGTPCRPSTGDCDPVEVCVGSSSTCPLDIGGPPKVQPFLTSYGYDGSTTSINSVYDRNLYIVEAGCYKSSDNTIRISRGYLAFKTSSLKASKVLAATLQGCHAWASAGTKVTLYESAFNLPLIPSNHNAPASKKVMDLASTKLGTVTYTLPTAALGAVRVGQHSYFTIRSSDESACAAAPVKTDKFHRWASSQGGSTSTNNCQAPQFWRLTVTYCP